MMRRVWTILAACALAACAAGERDAAPVVARSAYGAPLEAFEFVLHTTDAGVVDSVFVTRAGRRVQTLVPSRPQEGALLDDPTYRVDLDFDGHLDFGLVTVVPAAPNPAYDYWRYDPAADRFRYVGNYELFEPDSAERVLFTHARGGHAGRLWSNSRWQWRDGALVEIWRGEQTWAEDVERYVLVEHELREGEMAVVSADTLDESEVEPREGGGEVDEVTRLHPSLPGHAFALHHGEPGVVDSIVVSVDGERVQALRPIDNLIPAHAQGERLSTVDLDFDGHPDLAFLNSVGMANSRSEYWRFDPASRRFVGAGELETLKPDPAARELTTFTRGGHGGRLWTAARWRWVDGALVAVAEEEQATLDAERYLHVVRRRRDGKMVEARRDTLAGDAELRARPSWTEP